MFREKLIKSKCKGSAAGFLPVDPERQFIDYFSPDICRPIRFLFFKVRAFTFQLITSLNSLFPSMSLLKGLSDLQQCRLLPLDLIILHK